MGASGGWSKLPARAVTNLDNRRRSRFGFTNQERQLAGDSRGFPISRSKDRRLIYRAGGVGIHGWEKMTEYRQWAARGEAGDREGGRGGATTPPPQTSCRRRQVRVLSVFANGMTFSRPYSNAWLRWQCEETDLIDNG